MLSSPAAVCSPTFRRVRQGETNRAKFDLQTHRLAEDASNLRVRRNCQDDDCDDAEYDDYEEGETEALNTCLDTCEKQMDRWKCCEDNVCKDECLGGNCALLKEGDAGAERDMCFISKDKRDQACITAIGDDEDAQCPLCCGKDATCFEAEGEEYTCKSNAAFSFVEDSEDNKNLKQCHNSAEALDDDDAIQEALDECCGEHCDSSNDPSKICGWSPALRQDGHVCQDLVATAVEATTVATTTVAATTVATTTVATTTVATTTVAATTAAVSTSATLAAATAFVGTPATEATATAEDTTVMPTTTIGTVTGAGGDAGADAASGWENLSAGETPKPEKVFGWFALFFCLFFFANCILSLLGVIALKWLIIGRRRVGKQSWDEKNYCQRWQIFLCIEQLRRGVGFGGRGILDYFGGTAYICSYFRALGASIGEKVCLYPNGGDPMMTEPDLVTLGNCVAVDEASIVWTCFPCLWCNTPQSDLR